MRIAGECEDGDAHPECFAGCRGAVIGVGVEGDVDLVVDLQVAASQADPVSYVQTMGVDADVGE